MIDTLSDRKRLARLERETPFLNPSQSFRPELQPGRARPEAEPEESALAEAGEFPEMEGEAPMDRPEDAPTLPTDAALREGLANSPNKAIRELAKVMTLFGKPDSFGVALRAALQRISWEGEPSDSANRVALARLGVEAFLQGTTVPEENRVKAGFAHHPTRIGDASSPAQRQAFVHYAVEALRVRAKTVMTPLLLRRELGSAAALFAWVVSDLSTSYSTSGIPEPLLVAYRRLLVTVIWKHYQGLQDALVTEMRRSPASVPEVLKALKTHLNVAMTTNVQDEKATIPTYRTLGQVYRDYFNPAPATDIEYRHYTTGPLPIALKEFDTPFESVVRDAVSQSRFLENITKLSGTRPIPILHDSASWHAWLRGTWNGTWRGLFVSERLKKTLDLIEEYFRAFTIHVPFDLREGCAVTSYLARQFPRAVTGGRIHDCAVYAVRWLHMLGGIIGTKSPMAGISKPRIFLVDMPAHVGAMIRLNPSDGKELLVVINNERALLCKDVDADELSEQHAKQVVREMYPILATPFRLHPIAADPADATSFWKATCKVLDSKLDLPYGGPAEPHLRYLEYNKGVAALSDELAGSVRVLLDDLKRELAKQPTRSEIARKVCVYLAALKKAVDATTCAYDKRVAPLVKEIREDLARNRSLLPRCSKRGTNETEPCLKDEEPATQSPWQVALAEYRQKTEAAERGELPVPDPEIDFPRAHFPTAGYDHRPCSPKELATWSPNPTSAH